MGKRIGTPSTPYYVKRGNRSSLRDFHQEGSATISQKTKQFQSVAASSGRAVGERIVLDMWKSASGNWNQAPETNKTKGKRKMPDKLGSRFGYMARKVSDAKSVLRFIYKNIFTRFDTPRAFISDKGSQFKYKQVINALQKYGVKYRIATIYHPQSNGQVEVSNQEIKKILEKVMNLFKKEWSLRQDEALWAYRTAYKTPLRMSLFRLVYGKACHLPMELEHKTMWAPKRLNFDFNVVGEKRMMDLNKLEVLRNDAYESSRIYKEKSKRWHNKYILPRQFHVGQLVLLFNSRLKLFSRKLRFHWSGPFEIVEVYPHGALLIKNLVDGSTFKVNGQHLKHYCKEQPQHIASISLSEFPSL
ncbi:uncharacterized protein LOC120139357 [Hibiscus syriacus]|uniref:uncharacterized protein LOC120139357 n=1 Tax=Hibiscus syriacus TaxID=106335 RepID=UPI00192127DC|nr:uncharacterized protein LOC120139357 [Hibiscus syriacus]